MIHDRLKVKFRNEFGNPIEVSVSVSDDEKSVTIKTKGPKSTHENTLTKQEAETLTALLKEVFPDAHFFPTKEGPEDGSILTKIKGSDADTPKDVVGSVHPDQP